jgi:hypothetical protein
MLALKPTDLGDGKLEDDYAVFDGDRKPIGRILRHPHAPPCKHWCWSITVRVPQHPYDRSSAASREQAMADFKTAWLRKSVVVRRTERATKDRRSPFHVRVISGNSLPCDAQHY